MLISKLALRLTTLKAITEPVSYILLDIMDRGLALYPAYHNRQEQKRALHITSHVIQVHGITSHINCHLVQAYGIHHEYVCKKKQYFLFVCFNIASCWKGRQYENCQSASLTLAISG